MLIGSCFRDFTHHYALSATVPSEISGGQSARSTSVADSPSPPLYQLETALLSGDSLQILVAICAALGCRRRNVVSPQRTIQKPRVPEASVPSDKKRVAVIAIHGVGHHESGATAQAVTDLLAGVETGAVAHPRNRYTSFSLRQVQVPLPPAMDPYRDDDPNGCSKPPDPNEKHQWRLRAMFDERLGEFQTYYKWRAWFKRRGESDEHIKERKDSARKLDVATEFMNVQIQEFTGDE